jgi:hypothetical protein
MREYRGGFLLGGVVLSVPLLLSSIGATLMAIWTDSEHWSDTAWLFWSLLTVTWVAVFMFFVFTSEDF